MRHAKRLLTSIDVDSPDPGMSISALLELECTDGHRVTLLDDRGWSSTGGSRDWAFTSLQDLTDTARTVVGPDEPRDGVSYEGEAAVHWGDLAAGARAAGVAVQGPELAGLPHDVHISEEILLRLRRAAR